MINENNKMHVKFISRVPGTSNLFTWTCNGMIIKAKNILEVHRKYRDTKTFDEELSERDKYVRDNNKIDGGIFK